MEDVFSSFWKSLDFIMYGAYTVVKGEQVYDKESRDRDCRWI